MSAQDFPCGLPSSWWFACSPALSIEVLHMAGMTHWCNMQRLLSKYVPITHHFVQRRHAFVVPVVGAQGHVRGVAHHVVHASAGQMSTQQ